MRTLQRKFNKIVLDTGSKSLFFKVQMSFFCDDHDHKNDLFATLTGIRKKEKEIGDKIEVKLGVSNPNIRGLIDDIYSGDYLKLLKGNQEYVNEKTKENPSYFKNLAALHSPKYMMIGCVDARVPPNEMTKTNPGEIFIHRNIANQVLNSDINCMSAIQYAVEHLKVEHVIVMGHTKCGGILAATKKNYLGLIEQWLQNIKDLAYVRRDYLSQSATQEEFIQRLTEINVKVQALNVCKTPFVQKAWSEGRKLHVHGWLMDIETGLIKDLEVNNRDWENIKDIYLQNF